MIIKPKDLFKPFGNNIPKNFAMSDADYFCPTIDMINNELFPKYWRWLQSLKLTKWVHRWDCDNFADAFKLFCCGYYEQVIESDANGMGVGVMYYNAIAKAESGVSGGHAINLIYTNQEQKDDDGTDMFYLTFLEPQNGKIYNLTEEEFNSIWTVYI